MKNRSNQKSRVFTQRQLSVLQLWEENPQLEFIAEELGISKHTVHTHLRRMRNKIDARRTFEAWRYAKEQGWI